MARLPVPGKDSGDWGEILNDFLRQVHTAEGNLKDGLISESQLSETVKAKLEALQLKLDGVEPEADVTDADNVALAGAVMKTDSSLAGAAFG